MNRKILVAALAFALPQIFVPPARAQITETEKGHAIRLLAGRDLEQRTAARVTLRLAGTNIASQLQKTLDANRPALVQGAQRLASRFSAAHKGFLETVAALSDWQNSATQALAIIRTETAHDPTKTKELNDSFKDTQKKHDRLLRLLHQGDFADFVSLIKQLREIANDQSWCGDNTTKIDTRVPVSLEGVKMDDDVKLAVKGLQDFLDRETLRLAMDATHARHRWARPEYREFAMILNQRRSSVALRPLLLAERLGDAALGHSEEMAKLKYFAHESPVEENKSPWDRTKNAKFEGSAAGECIFAGSEKPDGAFGGWWGSDGHRFIMFGDDINALGLGRNGGTWTLLTGKLTAFPF